jgi:hypothetical protein
MATTCIRQRRDRHTAETPGGQQTRTVAQRCAPSNNNQQDRFGKYQRLRFLH